MTDNRTMAQLLEAPTEGACPHHGFSKLHQLDTFYNVLNTTNQDSLNSTAGGDFLDKMPRECLKIIESKSRVRQSQSKAVVAKVSTSSSTPAISSDVAELKDMVRALLLDKKKPSSSSRYRKSDRTKLFYQASALQALGVSKADFESYVKANDVVIRNVQTQDQTMQKQLTNLTDMLLSFVNANTASSSGSRTLPSNTVTNPKEDLKGITTRSGAAYQGPTIPSSVMNRKTEVTKDTVLPTNNGGINTCNALADLGASINLMPHSVWKDLSLPNLTPTCKTLELADRSITEPIDTRVPLILGRSFLKTSRALIDVYQGEITLRVGKEAIAFNLDQTSRYTANYDHMMANQIDVIDMACEEYSQEVLGFSNVITSGNPSPSFDPIVSTSSPTLTPFGDSNFFLFEEGNSFLSLEDDPTSPKVDECYYDSEGDILLLEEILNKFCTYKIHMEEDYEPTVQPQRRLNPKIHDVLKKEVEKFLDAGLIYPISDSPWVSPVHCVPKKGGITVVKNDDNDLISTRLVTGWRVCIDYRKLNEATRKDHFPLPFMDQMIERLAGNQYYCFLNGFSGYIQIPIDPKDQEKTTFTCPYRTFACRCMTFGLCNSPDTFQRCMMAIFHDMIEKTMEVFMDEFLVIKDSFSTCLSYLEKMLKRCKDTNLALNWEKIHFMVKEGIVL
uniref:Reverse transcriptase domain-containing protein n=1 Tax=Tanacetum cinerariifolium TaxID=118510 RepID=A0A6L2K8J4_TANCI|nr:reverse transcriptase domain-containing protein [Tanacetum cinerariifolium]